MHVTNTSPPAPALQVDEVSGQVSPLEDDLAVFSLAMVQRALLAAGPQLHAFEPLVALVHTELFSAMVHVVRQPSLGVINGVNQVGARAAVQLSGSNHTCAGSMCELFLPSLRDS